MARIVIADAGPLIALAGIGHLALLRRLFGRVSVASTVADEVLQGGSFPDGPALTQGFAEGWLQRFHLDSPDHHAQAQSLMNLHQIDAGEAMAMVLALQAQTTGDQALLVMDDMRGRNAVQHARLGLVGTAGLLLLAKRQGHIAAVEPLLLGMRRNGYFLSQRLIDSALQQAGE